MLLETVLRPWPHLSSKSSVLNARIACVFGKGLPEDCRRPGERGVGHDVMILERSGAILDSATVMVDGEDVFWPPVKSCRGGSGASA